MLEPTRRGRRKRLVRELLPVGAAAGAAAIAVTFIVGGSTAELVSPAQQGPWPVATSPSPTGAPEVITNAPAPRRDERGRATFGAEGELAAGPVALVTGSLTAPRASAGRGLAGVDGSRPDRPVRVAPAPAPAELAGPLPTPVPAPVVPVPPAETSEVTAATTARRPGRSGSAPGRTLMATPAPRPSRDATPPDVGTAAGTSSSKPGDPGRETPGQDRGNGPQAAPGQAHAAGRAAGDARTQPR